MCVLAAECLCEVVEMVM